MNHHCRKIGFLFLFSMILSACGSTQTSTQKTLSEPSENTEAIIFLVFKMLQDKQGNNALELLSQTQKFGKLKAESENTATSENYITIDLYENNRLYKTITKEHPLFKHVEYLDDNKQFVSKNITVKEDEFFFRIQKTGKPIGVKISEVIKNNPKKELINLKI